MKSREILIEQPFFEVFRDNMKQRRREKIYKSTLIRICCFVEMEEQTSQIQKGLLTLTNRSIHEQNRSINPEIEMN